MSKKVLLSSPKTIAKRLVYDLGRGEYTLNGDRASLYIAVARGEVGKHRRKVFIRIEEKSGLAFRKRWYSIHIIDNVDGADCRCFRTDETSVEKLEAELSKIFFYLEAGVPLPA